MVDTEAAVLYKALASLNDELKMLSVWLTLLFRDGLKQNQISGSEHPEL